MNLNKLFNKARVSRVVVVQIQSRKYTPSQNQTFYAKDLQIERREKLLEKPGDDHQYIFGGITTDHMLHFDYDKDNGGWQSPRIEPVKPLQLDPANATLHYSIECFEGGKAYRSEKDENKAIMFRLNKNFERMNTSHQQLGFPAFNIDEAVKCVGALIDIEKEWIPNRPNHSLYIRPNSICMDESLGLSQIKKMKTFVVLSPVGPYYPRGFVPVRLYCDTQVVRAWPNGFGDKKIGGNYAPTIKTSREGIEAHNCDQVLWLLHDYVTEVGTMNLFVFWKNENGEDELITPPLDGTILPGITRQSIIEMTRELKEFKVVEKSFKIQEMIKAEQEGRLYEAFGAGTAASVAPVQQFQYGDTIYKVPIEEEAQAGPLAQRVVKMLQDVQYGRVERPEWQIEAKPLALEQ